MSPHSLTHVVLEHLIVAHHMDHVVGIPVVRGKRK